MPGRIFKDSMCRSDDMSKLSWFEQVVFTRLIVTADDFGRLDGRIPIIRSAAFPLDLDRVSVDDLENAISSIEKVGMIRRYTVNKKPYIYIPTWDKYQSRRAKESKFPDPNADECDSEDCDDILNADVNILKQDENICKQDESICEQIHPITDKREPINDNREPINDNREPINDNRCNVESAPAKFTDEIKTVVAAWNDAGLQAVRSISSKSTRYKMICARLNESGLDGVLEAIERIGKSRFLHGDNNNGWVISFDWFLKPSNFQKVIEGNYDDRQVRPRQGQESTPDRIVRMIKEGRFDDPT